MANVTGITLEGAYILGKPRKLHFSADSGYLSIHGVDAEEAAKMIEMLTKLKIPLTLSVGGEGKESAKTAPAAPVAPQAASTPAPKAPPKPVQAAPQPPAKPGSDADEMFSDPTSALVVAPVEADGSVEVSEDEAPEEIADLIDVAGFRVPNGIMENAITYRQAIEMLLDSGYETVAAVEQVVNATKEQIPALKRATNAVGRVRGMVTLIKNPPQK